MGIGSGNMDDDAEDEIIEGGLSAEEIAEIHGVDLSEIEEIEDEEEYDVVDDGVFSSPEEFQAYKGGEYETYNEWAEEFGYDLEIDEDAENEALELLADDEDYLERSEYDDDPEDWD